MITKKALHSITFFLAFNLILLNLFSQKTPNLDLVTSNKIIDSMVENYLLNAQYELALKLTQQSAILANDSITKTYYLIRKSGIYLQIGDKQNAHYNLEQANNLKKCFRKRSLMIDFLYAMHMGILMEQYGNVGESYLWLTKSKNILKMDKKFCDLDKINLYMNLGILYYEIGDSFNTIKYYKKAIEILYPNTTPEKILKLNCLSYLEVAGYYFNRADIINQTKVQSNKIIESLENPNHPALLTFYFNQIEIYLNKEYNILFARQTMDKVSNILDKYYQNESFRYGLLYYYQGQYAYIENDFEKAFAYLKQSETYLINNPNLIVPMSQINFLIGNIFLFYKKDFKQSINYYDKVRRSYNKRTQKDVAKSYFLTGFAYVSIGNREKALVYTQKGIEIVKKINTWGIGDALSYSYRCLSGIYKILGDNDTAYQFMCKAFKISMKYSKEKDLKAVILRDLAFYYKNKGEFQQALQKYQYSLILCGIDFKDTSIYANPVNANISLEKTMIETLNMKAYCLFQLYEKKGYNIKNLIAALKCHEISIMNLEKRIIDMDNENSKFNWKDLINVTFNNAVSYASLLYKITGDKKYSEKAFHYSEESKMLIMLLHTQEKYAKQYSGIPDSLIERETLIHNEILNIQNTLYQDEIENIASFKERLIARLANLQLESDRLKSLYEQHYKHYYDYKYNLQVPEIHQIQQNLKKNQVLLEYQLLTSELIIMLISKDKFSLHHIPLIGNEIQEIQRFQIILTENPIQKNPEVAINEFVESSNFLFKWLVEPIISEIKGRNLIIVPHNELNIIPFELLISNKTNVVNSYDYRTLDYLFRHFAISYAYSATLLFERLSNRQKGKEAAFFLPDYALNSDYHMKLTPLLGAKEEVETIGKLTNGDIFEGYQVSKSSFKLLSTNYKVLHIASHTVLNDVVPSLSALVLNKNLDSNSSNNELLYSYELYQLQLNAQLVVLSGCNTGLGKLQKGEGLLSLARSFFYTGVSSIVYTLWTVADKPGSILMKSFYKQLLKGKKLDEALKYAKLEYLRIADPAKTHPYYWGSYLIVGNTNPIYLNNRGFFKNVLLLLILASGIGSIVFNTLKFDFRKY